MSQNLFIANASTGTVSLTSPVNALTIVAGGSNPFYFSTSSSAAAPTPSDATNAGVGGVSYVLRSNQGIQSIRFLMVDSTNLMTLITTINISAN